MNGAIKRIRGFLEGTKKKFRRSYTSKLLNSLLNRMLSYHGLLVVMYYDNKIRHLILNPITGVQVSFHIPYTTIVALFFHPVANDYYAIGARFRETMKQEYILFQVSSLLLNEVDFERGWKKLNYRLPTVSPSPIMKTDAIYWMVDEKHPANDGDTCCGVYVIVFDIKKEKFHVVSHPGERCDSQILKEKRARMQILEKEGVVSFCAITCHVEDTAKMQFWNLEDQYN
ncbi:hypothetical protein RDI58_002946 [Solanum bulbocastanum]|uniref:F-box associated beta-propeller type 3 domain-containing protein n=1 Tax=Solanum bulbocastanum TaxID=147425 RepID=A0AAN8UGZ4_SOLBU